jgi:hypothetical protein
MANGNHVAKAQFKGGANRTATAHFHENEEDTPEGLSASVTLAVATLLYSGLHMLVYNQLSRDRVRVMYGLACVPFFLGKTSF